MHEMGIVLELMDSLKDVMKENGIAELEQVDLSVGEASMVVPRFFKECWEAARLDTVFKNTKLVIHMKTAHGICLRCGHRFAIKRNKQTCPYCGANNTFNAVDGTELEILSVSAKETA